MRRRRWLLGGLLGSAAVFSGLPVRGQTARPPALLSPEFARVVPGRTLRFARDHGGHPDFRTEWWYLTGWVQANGIDVGVQLTFFRARTTHAVDNPSRFAPTQLILGHAALAIKGEPRLRYAQRSARAGFGLAQASESDTDLRLFDWSLRRQDARPGGNGAAHDAQYRAIAIATDFALDLTLEAKEPPLLQGDGGFSRKGPHRAQASYYYSRPQLRLEGQLRIGTATAQTQSVAGRGWLDHEWSSELLDPRASGWDWTGLNLDDGSALMAFRIRTREGNELWKHARWSSPRGTKDFSPRFEVVREWQSLRSGARYPVAMRLSIDDRTLELQPLLLDQELDTRASTGTVYWEGAVRVFENGRPIGRGYLELTGYAGRVGL